METTTITPTTTSKRNAQSILKANMLAFGLNAESYYNILQKIKIVFRKVFFVKGFVEQNLFV